MAANDLKSRIATLTPRHRQVLRLVSLGCSVAEIADILLNRHPPMPRALLRDDEIEDIVGYLAALGGS